MQESDQRRGELLRGAFDHVVAAVDRTAAYIVGPIPLHGEHVAVQLFHIATSIVPHDGGVLIPKLIHECNYVSCRCTRCRRRYFDCIASSNARRGGVKMSSSRQVLS
jgi:hypothetical protein